MGYPVIVEAVRTPIGRRGGALSGLKATELLQHVQTEVLRRAAVRPERVGQIIGGCVTQVGEQSLNVTRNAWLNGGHDYRVPATTVDVSCGSSQQANHIIAAMIEADAIDVGIACGVESMSRVHIGTNLTAVEGHYKTRNYPYNDPPRAQFGGAERIAERMATTRAQADRYGVRSQQRAAVAVAERRFDCEIAPLEAPTLQNAAHIVDLDEGIRPTALETLSQLEPVAEGGIHTAATTSQISDGAAAILWMDRAVAEQLGLNARARLRAQVVVGSDPYYLLDGPIDATAEILARTGLGLDDIDLYEVNEAFAGVVLAWQRTFEADWDRLNVNGGAIALGHPLGATGTRLFVTALHELERTRGSTALVAMCCGGAIGTASILERVRG